MSVTLNGVPSSKPFVHVILEQELLDRIDDFRYGMRIPSRNAAIRWLLESALDQNPLAEPDMGKHDSHEPRPGDPKTGIFDPPSPKRRR